MLLVKGLKMGRNTSINIYREDYYNYLKNIEKVLYNELTSGELYSILETESDIIVSKLEQEELAYWGKSNCNEIVEWFKRYKENDGDLIIDSEIMNSMRNLTLFDEDLIKEIYLGINDGTRVVVYTTNG